MPITTLLAVAVALCLQDKLVLSVVLHAANRDSRDVWGVNDILLICRDGDHEVANAIFTRNGNSISANENENCSPGGVTYCVEEDGSRLRFIASALTEGKFACKNTMNVKSDEIAIIGKRVLRVLDYMYIHVIRY